MVANAFYFLRWEIEIVCTHKVVLKSIVKRIKYRKERLMVIVYIIQMWGFNVAWKSMVG